MIQCNGLDAGKWNDSETAALNAECDLIANLLVRADEMLALVAIQDAKDTPVRDPHRAGQVQHEIALAEKELARAYREWDEHEYDEAIGVFEHAWHHAELAIKLANK